MSEELQSLVQIIELYGKGLGGLGRALRFSAKGAAKGVEIAQVKRLQHRMKLHYASEGTHNTQSAELSINKTIPSVISDNRDSSNRS